MVADNDAGDITTYAATGAKYGFNLIWFLLILIPVAYYVQEMTVRLGAVTKRGHAEAIFDGFGAFWGEVNSSVHKALGCLGVITDGSIRDIPQWAPGFQALAGMINPSHAHVHLDDFGKDVCVAGMNVRSNDLIHADRHGAIVIPIDIAAKVPDAAELCGRREEPILSIARDPSFTFEKLKAAMAKSAEIH